MDARYVFLYTIIPSIHYDNDIQQRNQHIRGYPPLVWSNVTALEQHATWRLHSQVDSTSKSTPNWSAWRRHGRINNKHTYGQGYFSFYVGWMQGVLLFRIRKLLSLSLSLHLMVHRLGRNNPYTRSLETRSRHHPTRNKCMGWFAQIVVHSCCWFWVVCPPPHPQPHLTSPPLI